MIAGETVQETERQLAALDVASSPALFVVGLGEGLVLEALDRQGWTGRVVAFEPGPAPASARRDWSGWLKTGRLTILQGPSYDGLDAASASLEPTRRKPVIFVNMEVAQTCVDAAKQAVSVAARGWFGAYANAEARRENAGRYLLNTLRNAHAIGAEGDAAALAGASVGLPALVVAAGPSLDRNLPDIVAVRDRVVTIAADTALRPLLVAGVEPDLVVAVDPGETNARHLSDLPECPGTYLVAEGSLDPEALRHFTSRTFFFRVADHHPWPWLRSLGIDRGRLRAWGSVLTTAFDLALTMGCDPIVFAGSDLAFTDGRPYARGTIYEENWRREQRSGHTLDEVWRRQLTIWPEMFESGIGGERVRTAAHLRSFRDWIVNAARAAVDRTIINASGGGILVGPGIRQKALATALLSAGALDASARAAIVGAWRCQSGGVERVTRGELTVPTLNTWSAFAGADLRHEDVMRALGRISTPAPQPAVSLVVDAGDQPEEKTPPDAKTPETRDVTLVCTDSPVADLLSRIEEAWSRVPRGARLVLDDRTVVPGGEQVRRALFAFLDGHPGFTARYGRFFDPHANISWIDSRPSTETAAGFDLDKFGTHHAAVASRLTALIVERFRPKSVFDVGCGAGHWVQAFKDHGVSDVNGVEDAALLAASNVTAPPGVTAVDLAAVSPTRCVDLSLCLGVVQRMPAHTAEAVVAACTRASDTVIFSAPAPGIAEAGFINERPWIAWHRLFWSYGFVMHDELRPVVEERWGGYQSHYDLLVVYRRVGAASGDNRTVPMDSAVLAAAQRIDDQVLRGHWQYQALDACTRASMRAQARTMPYVEYGLLEIVPARMQMAGGSGVREFTLRTVAAVLALASAGVEAPIVTEDGRGLRQAATLEQVRNGPPGSFAIDGDTVTFSSSDQSDPRHNGRRYSIRVPAHVAFLERQAIATILEQQL